MAGIVYELIEVLKEEQECYEGLNTLASYTQTAVINKNIEFLQEVVKTEEEFIGRINYLDSQREGYMKDIALVTGMNGKDITVSKIIEKIGEGSEAGKTLAELRESIKATVDEIKTKTELNKQLLSDSLELVDFMVNAIGSTKGYVHVGNYNGPGQLDMNVERQQSIFDKKQ